MRRHLLLRRPRPRRFVLKARHPFQARQRAIVLMRQLLNIGLVRTSKTLLGVRSLKRPRLVTRPHRSLSAASETILRVSGRA